MHGAGWRGGAWARQRAGLAPHGHTHEIARSQRACPVQTRALLLCKSGKHPPGSQPLPPVWPGCTAAEAADRQEPCSPDNSQGVGGGVGGMGGRGRSTAGHSPHQGSCLQSRTVWPALTHCLHHKASALAHAPHMALPPPPFSSKKQPTHMRRAPGGLASATVGRGRPGRVPPGPCAGAGLASTRARHSTVLPQPISSAATANSNRGWLVRMAFKVWGTH